MNWSIVTCVGLSVGMGWNAQAQPQAPDGSRLANVQEVPLSQVRIADSFWAPRRETNRTVSLPHSLDMLERSGNISNLELAAAGKREGYKGPVFMDSDLFKSMESVAYSLATDPDPLLDARLDAVIAKVAAAQRPDGYLNTWYQVHEPDKRFTNLRDNHELYCAGHLFEAAVAHFRATGKKNLLDVATKYADLLCATFGQGPGKRPGYCGHPEIELALVKLARATGTPRYFALAKYFTDSRGSGFFADEHGTPRTGYNGEYWQDNCPIREQEHVIGHAVRFGYLMSACVDIGAETGDQGLLRMSRRVWRNTAERNTYITGGIGPSASNEGFTSDYDLPNLTAYQETCASVAMAMWNHRMNLAYGDAKYADCMETALYNGILSGVSLDGRKFFYVNPLESTGGHHRSDWFSCACCPPNVTRTLAALGNYVCGVNDAGLWVNLYVQGEVKTQIEGADLVVAVTTEYPWSGEVRLKVMRAPTKEVNLRLRVPGWCEGATVRVNGAAPMSGPVEQGYLKLAREWAAGDTVELELPMPVRRVESNPNVVGNRGSLAIARGPLVYCVEGCDVDAPLSSMAVHADAKLEVTKEPALLGGVVTIRGEGLAAAAPEWRGALYRTAQPPQAVAFKAVPYYAWDNRRPGPMRVWHPTTPPPARVMGLEQQARVSLSFSSGYCQPEGIHDGIEPRSSSEQPAALCHWWPHKGGSEWVAYSWDSARDIAGVSLYWFDDTGRGECRLPKSWRLMYDEGGTWKPVKALMPLGIAKDKWIEVTFEPLRTTGLRLEIDMQEGWAAGIHEWKVVAPAAED